MKDVIYIKRITRVDAKSNPHILFVYGDNDDRNGYGGLAKELRGERNSYGIRVKKNPCAIEGAYYTDDEYEDNVQKIREDINRLSTVAKENCYLCIIFPIDGIGTGLAQMKLRCPKTFKFLCNELMESLNILNGVQE